MLGLRILLKAILLEQRGKEGEMIIQYPLGEA